MKVKLITIVGARPNFIKIAPLILNTSFNTHEHPIVCSHRDAIDSFLQGAVDILAIGNFIVASHNSNKKL